MEPKNQSQPGSEHASKPAPKAPPRHPRAKHADANAPKPRKVMHRASERKSAEHKSTEHKHSEHKPSERKNAKKKGGDQKKKWTSKRIIAACVVGVLLLTGAGIFFYQRYTYESTDDAMVRAHTTLLAPKVSGIVTQVLIDEHERVKAGQVLVRLEQKDYLAALESARANLESVAVKAASALRDSKRAAMLLKSHAITNQNYDHALANSQDLERQVKAAQAELEQAKLNLEYTELRAPTDGYISRKSVEIGMNASAGMALFGFVQTDERWVIANFKETQLDSIQVGKQVKVSVDAIPGRTYHGIVESISPSSGAQFTLFPPDNATGNYTKVVQRVPVRIYLKDLKEEDYAKLQAGLSADVDVIKHSALEQVPPRANEPYLAQLAQSLPLTNGASLQMEQKQALPRELPSDRDVNNHGEAGVDGKAAAQSENRGTGGPGDMSRDGGGSRASHRVGKKSYDGNSEN